jgi:hypothetical protein
MQTLSRLIILPESIYHHSGEGRLRAGVIIMLLRAQHTIELCPFPREPCHHHRLPASQRMLGFRADGGTARAPDRPGLGAWANRVACE